MAVPRAPQLDTAMQQPQPQQQHQQPFVTPDELKRAQADSRAPGKADPWTSRYVRGSLSSLAPPESGVGVGSGSSRASSRSPSPAAETIKATLASNRGLGSAMPSSINRDLRSSGASTLSSASSFSGRASTASNSSSATVGAYGDVSIGSDYTSPTLEGQDGTLSKVVGSLIDPVESRKNWTCAGCGVVFARDSTIYASPENGRPNAASSSSPLREKKSSAYFCRACFTDRFSIGICASTSCGKPVLGSTKEDGKFVRAGEAIWHGRCWRCTLCARGGGDPPLGDGEAVMVGMDGQPTCEDCFGKKRPVLGAAKPPTTVQRERTITKARPHSTTYVSAVPESKQTFSTARSAAENERPSRQNTSGPPQTMLSRGDTIKARPQSLDITPRPGFVRGLSGASLNRFSQQAPGSGTVAELSKRFGSTVSPTLPAASPRLNGFGSPTAFNTGIFSASSSTTIMPLSPAMATTPTMESCPTPKLTRTNSLTGSPPKPRPLTASFSAEKGFNLSAFNATGRDMEGGIKRSDSRSRSVSPVKRNVGLPRTESDFDTMRIGEFGSSAAVAEPRASHAVSGRDSPAKSTSSSRQSSPDRKPHVHEKEADEQDDAMRCAACGLGAFDGPNQSSDDAVLVTLRQGTQLHAECLRCSICAGAIDPQRTFIRLDDLSYAELAPGLGAFAHPTCAPSVTIKRPEPAPAPRGERVGRAKGVDVSDDESHPTHQRAPRPSQDTQPPPSSAAANRTILDFSTAASAAGGGPGSSGRQLPQHAAMRRGAGSASRMGSAPGMVGLRPSGVPGRGASPDRSEFPADAGLRRFQPSAGAAPPTRSSLNVTTRGVPVQMAMAVTAAAAAPAAGSGGGAENQRLNGSASAGLSSQRNPAAGIFARRMAEINSKSTSAAPASGGLPQQAGGAGARLGGMLTCGGCSAKLSMLESVAGPRGTSWHRACLVCGGDRSGEGGGASASAVSAFGGAGHSRRANTNAAANAAVALAAPVLLCGKKLDSGAKVNIDGRVRCRECYDREIAARRLAAAGGSTGPSGTLTGPHRLAA